MPPGEDYRKVVKGVARRVRTDALRARERHRDPMDEGVLEIALDARGYFLDFPFLIVAVRGHKLRGVWKRPFTTFFLLIYFLFKVGQSFASFLRPWRTRVKFEIVTPVFDSLVVEKKAFGCDGAVKSSDLILLILREDLPEEIDCHSVVFRPLQFFASQKIGACE